MTVPFNMLVFHCFSRKLTGSGGKVLVVSLDLVRGMMAGEKVSFYGGVVKKAWESHEYFMFKHTLILWLYIVVGLLP